MKQLNLKTDNNTYFHIGDTELIKLCENGDIYVKGKLVENDKVLVEALREFIERSNIGGATTPPDWVTAKTRFINDFNKKVQRQEHNNPNYFIEEKPVRKNKARRRK